MAVYWLLFGYFAVGAVFASSLANDVQRRPNLLFGAGALFMAVVIGFRYKVGGDWSTYQFIYDRAGQLGFSAALSLGDPGYQAINWVSYQFGGNMWFVNLLCGAIFVWGLFKFSMTQPTPWLSAVTAIPYMVIVIAMGYTRQAVALGILMAGISAFIRGGSLLRFAVYVAVAAFFHKTAVVAFPVVALATQRNRFANMLLVAAAGIALYDAFLGNAMDQFVQNYIRAKYSSQGATIRILMNLVAATIFWTARKRLEFTELEWRVWRNFSIASVASLIMLLVSPSSTAIDRISLYLIPLQIAVLPRLPKLFRTPLPGTIAVATYSLIVEFVWLNFAQFAALWVPYRFFPISG